MIVKRNTTDKPGRTLAGLDEANKAARGGGLMNFGFGASSAGGKRSGMSCKGVVDITDIVATDVGDGGMHFMITDILLLPDTSWSRLSPIPREAPSRPVRTMVTPAFPLVLGSHPSPTPQS